MDHGKSRIDVSLYSGGLAICTQNKFLGCCFHPVVKSTCKSCWQSCQAGSRETITEFNMSMRVEGFSDNVGFCIFQLYRSLVEKGMCVLYCLPCPLCVGVVAHKGSAIVVESVCLGMWAPV